MAAETVNVVLAVANITADPAPAVSMVSYFCDTTGGGFDVTVPNVADVTDGIQIRVTLSVGVSTVVVTTVGGTDLIGTATSQAITQAGTGITIQANAGAGKWEIIQDSRGGGHVVGPASAVDENIALFDGVTGKLIKDAGINLSEIIEEDLGAGIGLIESGVGVSPIILKNIKDGQGTQVISNTGSIQTDIHFSAIDQYFYSDVSGNPLEGTITAAGRAILDDASVADQRTTLGLGSLATVSSLTGPVTSTGAATAIADAALSIAKTSGLQTALDAKADKSIAIRTYTGTTDTLVIGDAGNMVRGNNAGANTCTIPLNAVVAFPIGTQILFVQRGAGQMSIAITGGGTLNSYGGALKLVGQYAQALVTKVDTDEWSIDGNLTT